MTDPGVADVVYLEPLTVAERRADPRARAARTASCPAWAARPRSTCASQLAREGVLERHGIRLLGTPLEAIEMAEDRQAFRALLDRIGQPYPPSRDRRGRDAAGTAGTARVRRSTEIGAAGRHPARLHARRLGRWHRRRRRTSTSSAFARVCAPAPSARSSSSATSSAGRRSSTRSCATPPTRASRSARWRTSTRWACTPATRSSSRRSRRCPTRSHQRLRQRGAGDHPRTRRRGRLQRPVRAVARPRRVRGHRGQPARLALVGAGVQGDRLPDRARSRPDRDRPPARRDPATRSPARPSPRSSPRSTTSWSSCRASRSTSSPAPSAASARR